MLSRHFHKLYHWRWKWNSYQWHAMVEKRRSKRSKGHVQRYDGCKFFYCFLHNSIFLSKVVTFQSSLRNFDDQKSLWEDRYNNMYGYLSEPLFKSLAILTQAAMPTTSRHHWGTDFDIVNGGGNSYYDSGNGLLLYTWLQENAATYGFVQTYTPDSERLWGI